MHFVPIRLLIFVRRSDGNGRVYAHGGDAGNEKGGGARHEHVIPASMRNFAGDFDEHWGCDRRAKVPPHISPSKNRSDIASANVLLESPDGSGAVWAFKQDVGGRYVGSILGWGNMWGNLGAAIAAPMLIKIAGEIPHRRWDYVFMTCAAAFFISGVAAMGVNATIPIAPPDEDEQADGDEMHDQ